MPLTVFFVKGIPYLDPRRERIQGAVEAGGRHVSTVHGAWIAVDPIRGGVKVLITGSQGFERKVTFALDDDPVQIAEKVRETLEE